MSIEKSIQKLTNAITAVKKPDLLPTVRYTCKTTTIGIGSGPYCQCQTKSGCLVFSAQGVCPVDGFSDVVPINRPCLNGGTPLTHGQE